MYNIRRRKFQKFKGWELKIFKIFKGGNSKYSKLGTQIDCFVFFGFIFLTFLSNVIYNSKIMSTLLTNIINGSSSIITSLLAQY